MDLKESEYNSLKQEILAGIGYRKNYNSWLYSITSAVFTFAFTQSEPLIFLVPIVVIIPTFLMSVAQTMSILRIGAYILVFYEDEQVGWETRLAKLDRKYSPKNPHISSHVFITICCFILCLIKCNYKNGLTLQLIIRVAIDIIFLMICLGTIFCNKVDYKIEKEKYIEYWKKIKQEEST